MISQCLPNYFSSFTQHQYSPNKSSTIYQETIHPSLSSQLILNFLPSQYWPKFDQGLAKLWCWLTIEKCLISSLWHWDTLCLRFNRWHCMAYLAWAWGFEYTCIVVPSVAAQVYPPKQAHAAPDAPDQHTLVCWLRLHELIEPLLVKEVQHNWILLTQSLELNVVSKLPTLAWGILYTSHPKGAGGSPWACIGQEDYRVATKLDLTRNESLS